MHCRKRFAHTPFPPPTPYSVLIASPSIALCPSRGELWPLSERAFHAYLSLKGHHPLSDQTNERTNKLPSERTRLSFRSLSLKKALARCGPACWSCCLCCPPSPRHSAGTRARTRSPECHRDDRTMMEGILFLRSVELNSGLPLLISKLKQQLSANNILPFNDIISQRFYHCQ